jgi:hypothetical protein
MIVQQFHQHYFELPEDGAPNGPKHVGARWYTSIWIFECILLVFRSPYFCSISKRVCKYVVCKYNGLFVHPRKRKLILTWNLFFFPCLPTTVWFFCRCQKITTQHFELKLIKKNRPKCGKNILTLYSNLKSPTNRIVWGYKGICSEKHFPDSRK